MQRIDLRSAGFVGRCGTGGLARSWMLASTSARGCGAAQRLAADAVVCCQSARHHQRMGSALSGPVGIEIGFRCRAAARCTCGFSSRRNLSDIKALEAAAQALAPSALAGIRRWFTDLDAAAWDRELNADSFAASLEKPLTEADEDDKTLTRRAL